MSETQAAYHAQPALFDPPPPDTALARVFRAVLDQARRSGRDQHRTLHNGAAFVVRACDGGWIYVTIKRPNVPVGDVEEETFRRHFGIPASARRWPAAGQLTKRDAAGTLYHWLCYAWRDMQDA